MVRLVVLAALGLAVGCAPRLAPPYRDYRAPTVADDSLAARLVAAVTEAGWEVVSPREPMIVSTAPRAFDGALASSTEATLDLVPFDGGIVRVYVLAERRTLLGGRTKVYALSPGLREAVLGPLTTALADRGLVALDAPRDRDEEAVE